MARATLLVVTAHPDDESFGPGGTIARYARLGVRVVLACATRGEAGQAGHPPLCSPAELPRVREQELRAAAAVLGIAAVHLLGYRDRELEQADPEGLVGRIAAVLAATAPDAVLTMPPGGISGHPDHRAVCRATNAAFFRARHGAAGPRALYYWTLPAARIRAIRGEEPAHPLDTACTTVVDVSATLETKIAAIGCHRTQHRSAERVFAGFPPAVREELRREQFYRYFPPPAPAAPPETELQPLGGSGG